MKYETDLETISPEELATKFPEKRRAGKDTAHELIGVGDIPHQFAFKVWLSQNKTETMYMGVAVQGQKYLTYMVNTGDTTTNYKCNTPLFGYGQIKSRFANNNEDEVKPYELKYVINENTMLLHDSKQFMPTSEIVETQKRKNRHAKSHTTR